MQLQNLNEAKYRGGERGSFDWILNTFFGKPEVELGVRFYQLKHEYLAIYRSGYVIDRLEVNRDGTHLVYRVGGGNPIGPVDGVYFAENLEVYQTKDRAHP